MYLSLISLAALASAPLTLAQLPSSAVTTTTLPTTLPIALPAVLNYPFKQVLPVPGWNTTTESFDTLAALYSSSSQQLSTQLIAIAQRNIALNGSGGVEYSYEVQANLITSLAIVNNLFWQTSYEGERKVCAIVSSINEQNVDKVKGNLAAAINTQVRLIQSVSVTLANTIAAVRTQISQFTEAEKAVLSTLIQAIVTAAASSIGPLVNLNAGLSATGVAALNEVVQSLQTAILGLQSATTIDWTITE